jgi:uncharacterized membrane protein YkvA (DUF1232 family)
MKFIKSNWLLILSLVYVLSPLDFIPELLLGPIGIIDDGGLLIVLLIKATYSFIKESKMENKNVIEGEEVK